MLVYNEAQLQVEFQKLNLKNNVLFVLNANQAKSPTLVRDMIFTIIDGEAYGVWNVCPHRKATFSDKNDDQKRIHMSEKTPNAIRCPWHGNEFDIKTGLQVSGPSKCSNAHTVKLHHNPLLPHFYWYDAIPEAIIKLINGRQYSLQMRSGMDSPYNWKQPVETFAENLHIPYIHETLKEAVSFKDYKVDNYDWGQVQHVTTKDEDPYYGTAPGDVANFVIYRGNFLMEFVGDTLIIQHILPITADKSRVEVYYYRCDGKSDSKLFYSFMETLMEDEQLTRARQIGKASMPFASVEETQSYHHLEIGLAHFYNWYKKSLKS